MKRLFPDKRILFGLIVLVGLMIGLTFASVPLYSLFCRATGLGGTTQRSTRDAARLSDQSKDRMITVSFDGNVDRNLPWDFKPEVKSVQVKLGEVTTIKYRAHNRGSKTVVGTATYNVQPDKAGLWFDKIQCFCFTKQSLKPGETEDLAVQFYIDPAIADDHQNDDVQNITLSYTFFLAKDQS